MGTEGKKDGEEPTLLTWLGFTSQPNWKRARLLGGLVGASLVVLFSLAYVAAFAVALYAITSVFGEDATGPNLGVGTLVAAILGAPFLIWRTMVAQKTVDHAAKSLFNEKINAAVQDLYSQRQVTWTNDDGEHFNAWDDDILKRSAAIDRLFGLAKDIAVQDPEELHRIASMLSLYVRELSREPKLQAILPPEDIGPEDEQDWVEQLPTPRSDLERAVQVLGSLRPLARTKESKPQIDLRNANLQKMDLRKLDLVRANLGDARLHGANLRGTKMLGAGLSGRMFDARANLKGTELCGASARKMDRRSLRCLVPLASEIFADMSILGEAGLPILPENTRWPEHWPKKKLDWDSYLVEWRAWQRTLDPPLPPEALPADE